MTNVVIDFTDTYCEATELHYDELIKAGLTDDFMSKDRRLNNYKPTILFVDNSLAIDSITLPGITQYYKQIEYSTNINQWIYVKDKNRNIDGSIVQDKPIDSGIVVLLNNFEDYGFTADFEGEILKEDEGYFHGFIKPVDTHHNLKPMKYEYHLWNSTGGVETGALSNRLVPIKPKWYEDASNFPILCYVDDNLKVLDSVEYNILSKDVDFRLATDEQIDSLKINQ